MAAIKKLELDLMSLEIHMNAFKDLLLERYPSDIAMEEHSLKAINLLTLHTFNNTRHAPKLPDRLEVDVNLAAALMHVLLIAAKGKIPVGSIVREMIEYDLKH